MNETQFNRFPRIGVTQCTGLIALLGVAAGIASIFALRHGFPITARYYFWRYPGTTIVGEIQKQRNTPRILYISN